MKATELLKKDHDRVKQLFKEVKSAGGDRKEEILATLTEELRIHSDLEEKVFYPAVKTIDADEVIRFQEAHHDIEEVLVDLEDLTAEDEEFDQRVRELEQDVIDHISEEEGDLFPRVEEQLKDRLAQIGTELSNLKKELSGGRKAA
ncbi:MAG: hemerythrin domain-containing protein [Candidatus Manganitrophus sp.]|nr:hemerythrin domain-containing protein [Candidatus Manganitrophus sp.]